MSSELIWRSAGAPQPHDSLGDVIPKSGRRGLCAKCGTTNGEYTRKQVFSENFLPTRNSNRLRVYGGDLYCAACIFCAKTLRLRCISWFASEQGFQFWPTWKSDGLNTLLNPPPPPFVAAIPFYGIAHGGEAHYRRTWWPNDTPESNILVRLQSKHVAMYARTSHSRDLYPVQVDDQNEFVLDRDLWLRLRDSANTALSVAIAEGVSPYPAKLALRTLSLPMKSTTRLASQWSRLVAPLKPHVSTNWWQTFTELLPTPES